MSKWDLPPSVLRYKASQLREMPTLAQGQTDDLKIDTGSKRVWLARTSVEDGEPYNNRVTVERSDDGNWVHSRSYKG